MLQSHPQKWRYGGVLVRIDWIADPGKVRCWDGVVRQVRKGDTMVAIRTGAGLTIVDVERGSAAA